MPLQKFANAYRTALFTKFFGNSNENTKHIFTVRLKVPKTPTFIFIRKGKRPAEPSHLAAAVIMPEWTFLQSMFCCTGCMYALTWLCHPMLPAAIGAIIHTFTGANKEKMEDAMQQCLLPEENPVAGASKFRMQVWRSKLGLQ